MKILLLENEIMLRDSISEYLEALGHLVEVVSDGQKAYYKIVDSIPSVNPFSPYSGKK